MFDGAKRPEPPKIVKVGTILFKNQTSNQLDRRTASPPCCERQNGKRAGNPSGSNARAA
jgi:hypothetical protein